MANERSTTATKPFLPRLASTKSPITPRLATQHLRASPSQSATSVTSSRTDINRYNAAVRSPDLSRKDFDTPAKALLDSNITPRSSHRKSRLLETGSNAATPTDTSVKSSNHDAGHRSATTLGGNTGSVNTNGRPQSVLLPSLEPIGSVHSQMNASGQVGGSGNGAASVGDFATGNATFFHASDAKSSEVLPSRPQPRKAATFVYANGQEERRSNGAMCRSPSPTPSTMSTKSLQSLSGHSKFKASPSMAPRTLYLARNKSPEPRPALSRGQSSTSSASTHFSFRPPSPQKANLHLTYRKGVSQILPNRTPVPPVQTLVRDPTSPISKRRSTIETQSSDSATPHARSGSLNSIDTSPSSRKSSMNTGDLLLRQSIHARNSPIASSTSPRISTSHDTRQSSLDVSQDVQGANLSFGAQLIISPLSPTMTQSPGPKTTIQVPQNFAEAAANARRERKVLDLEISNSSLLAINRQLEREVRRQKMELRRFRRLSRAGRLSSIGSMAPHHEDIDGSGSEDDNVDSNMHHEDADASDEDGNSEISSSLSEESLNSSAMSPSVLTERGTARLEKDERRLRLDLDRHKQLLVDSQKMNQSLKRCMTWTEEMIAEGRKALAYKVNVSDVRLGGRVLQEEDIDESLPMETKQINDAIEDGGSDHEAEPRQGLLGSWSPPSASTPLALLVGAVDSPLGLALNMVPNEQSMKHYPVHTYHIQNEDMVSPEHISSNGVHDGYFPEVGPP